MWYCRWIYKSFNSRQFQMLSRKLHTEQYVLSRSFSMKGVKCVSPVSDPTATDEDKEDPNSTKTVSFEKGGVTNAYGTPWDIAILQRESTAGIESKTTVKR